MPRKEGVFSETLVKNQRRHRDRYKHRLFVGHLHVWQAKGRLLDEMPTLRTYHSGLEDTLRSYQLTDGMHIYRTGRPWPRNPDGTTAKHEQRESVRLPPTREQMIQRLMELDKLPYEQASKQYDAEMAYTKSLREPTLALDMNKIIGSKQ